MPEVQIYVDGRRAYTVEALASMADRSPSSIRARVHRRQIQPAGYVTRTVPVYYPEDLGLETPK